MYSKLLNFYCIYNFKLVKVSKDNKNPIENNWSNSKLNTYTLSNWKEWLKEGYNIGVLTGSSSNITVIDIDTKDANEELLKLMPPTFTQETQKGYHFFFKYNKNLPTTRIEHLKLDILNDGRQCILTPSVVKGHQRKVLHQANIAPMPKSLEEYLLNKVSKPSTQVSQIFKALPEGNRNNSLIQIGGILRKELNIKQTNYVMQLINRNFMQSPLPNKDIYNMTKSLHKYVEIDIDALSRKILYYLNLVNSANANDLKDFCGEDRDVITEALKKLEQNGWVVKHRKEYKAVKKLVWNDTIGDLGATVPFKIPFFDNKAFWCWGDILLIGGGTGTGKTVICMNILKELIEQGVKPYYISTESGSRHARVARELGLVDGQYYWSQVFNVSEIKLEEKAVTIIDWLLPSEYKETDKIFQFLAQQVAETSGLLIVFMQLKDGTREWFAPNLCKLYPSFATRYILNKERDGGIFKIDKIRDAKSADSYSDIICKYEWENKRLVPVNNLEKLVELTKEFEGEVV